MRAYIIKGVGKYADGVLTIITAKAVYEFSQVTGEYEYYPVGSYWHCGEKVTYSELELLRKDCNKYYEFDLGTFEVLESRKLK